MQLPPLKALPVFEAVARLNSFSKAADELNVTQSAVSHQIRQLEDYLGESLFHRQGRHLQLTTEGRLYLDNVTSALSQIERASDLLKGKQQTVVRLVLYSSFAVYWLIPRLADLKRACPQLELSIEMTHLAPELSDRTGDCFITVDHEKRGFNFDLLYRERLFPVCSTSVWHQICAHFDWQSDEIAEQYLAQHPECLAEFPLITAYNIFEQFAEDWRRWFAASKCTIPKQAKLHNFSHLLLATEAARHHQGIALINDYMFDTPQESSDLVKIPCHSVATQDNFYFSYKSSRAKEPGIQSLRQWLTRQSASLTRAF